MPPGASVKHVVTFIAVVAADANEFGSEAYREKLSAIMRVPSGELQMHFGRASTMGLRVSANIDFENHNDAAEVLSVLTKRSQQTSPSLSDRLGVPVVRVEALSLDMLVRTAPSPPPPEAPPLPPQPPTSPSPTYRSVLVSFLAPSHVADNTLGTARYIETTFAQAFDVPPSWLEIVVSWDRDQGILEAQQKGQEDQAAFAMTIQLKPEYYDVALVGKIRAVVGDEERLGHLLATAVPGATLVASSIASPAPPSPSTPPALPSPPSALDGSEVLCRLCPAGFHCPEGAVEPLPCEEGTEQPREGKAQCVAVAGVGGSEEVEEATGTSGPSVVLTLKASGVVADYDDTKKAAIKSKVAEELDVAVGLVSLRITAASVIIEITIAVPSDQTAEAMHDTVNEKFGTKDRANAALADIVVVEEEPMFSISYAKGEADEDSLKRESGVHAAGKLLSPDLVPVVATTVTFTFLCFCGIVLCAFRLHVRRKRMLYLDSPERRAHAAAGEDGLVDEARLAASMLKQATSILQMSIPGASSPRSGSPRATPAGSLAGTLERPRVSVLVQRDGEPNFTPAHPAKKSRFELRKKHVSEFKPKVSTASDAGSDAGAASLGGTGEPEVDLVAQRRQAALRAAAQMDSDIASNASWGSGRLSSTATTATAAELQRALSTQRFPLRGSPERSPSLLRSALRNASPPVKLSPRLSPSPPGRHLRLLPVPSEDERLWLGKMAPLRRSRGDSRSGSGSASPSSFNNGSPGAGVRAEVTLEDLKHSPTRLRAHVEDELKRTGSPGGSMRLSQELLRTLSPDELQKSPEGIRRALRASDEWQREPWAGSGSNESSPCCSPDKQRSSSGLRRSLRNSSELARLAQRQHEQEAWERRQQQCSSSEGSPSCSPARRSSRLIGTGRSLRPRDDESQLPRASPGHSSSEGSPAGSPTKAPNRLGLSPGLLRASPEILRRVLRQQPQVSPEEDRLLPKSPAHSPSRLRLSPFGGRQQISPDPASWQLLGGDDSWMAQARSAQAGQSANSPARLRQGKPSQLSPAGVRLRGASPLLSQPVLEPPSASPDRMRNVVLPSRAAVPAGMTTGRSPTVGGRHVYDMGRRPAPQLRSNSGAARFFEGSSEQFSSLAYGSAQSALTAERRLGSPTNTDNSTSANTPSVTPSSAVRADKSPPDESPPDDASDASSDGGRTFFSLAESEQSGQSQQLLVRAPAPRRQATSQSSVCGDSIEGSVNPDGTNARAAAPGQDNAHNF